MALSNENGGGIVMPVSPMGNGGYGFGGDGAWWLLILFALFMGNGGWGYGGGVGGGTAFVDTSVQRGFDQASVMGALGDIGGAIAGGFAGLEASANARQIADMQTMFGLQSQLSTCCCENRLATEGLKYTIAQENCQDRYEAANNTRDIIDNANRNNQLLLDKICSLELDAKNDRIAELERQLTAANFTASQIAQTAEIISKLPTTTTAA